MSFLNTTMSLLCCIGFHTHLRGPAGYDGHIAKTIASIVTLSLTKISEKCFQQLVEFKSQRF